MTDDDRRDECSHGSLRRSCEICERDKEIADLKAALKAADDANCRVIEGMTTQANQMAANWKDAENRAKTAEERVRELEKAHETLAISILGQEAYDNSPCQAHPFELIEFAFNKLKEAQSGS